MKPRNLLSFLIAFSLSVIAPQIQADDVKGETPGLHSGTIWSGKIPGAPSTGGNQSWWKLMWNSKVTDVKVYGRAQGGMGPVGARADLGVSYNVDTGKTTTTLDTRTTVGAGGAQARLHTSTNLATGKTDIAGNLNATAGPVRVDMSKKLATLEPGKGLVMPSSASGGSGGLNFGSGFGIMSSIKSAFGVGDWSKKVADMSTVSMNASIGGFGATYSNKDGNKDMWAGAGAGEVYWSRTKDNKTTIGGTFTPFSIPGAKLGAGVKISMVPMTPAEIKARDIRIKATATNFNNKFASSMAENMGFGL